MSASQSTIDPYQHMKIVYNPDDDTLTRLSEVPNTAAASDPNLPIPVLSKDLTINQSNNTWIRLFLPRKALDHGSKEKKKLPLIVFFHGSGFIVASAASTMFHDFCVRMADEIGAFVGSVEYRLAPEHRLPAAYDDAVEALHWIKTSDDDWLRHYADYSNCYIMGESAGGTIAYYAGLRVLEEVEDLEPLKIRGLMLRQPFFGGTERTQSEMRLVNDSVFPLSVSDLCWELALPIGVGGNRDHEYSNPTVGNGVEKMEKMGKMGWRVVMSGNEGDPNVDREREIARLMEEKGVNVVRDFDEEGEHGVEYKEPSKASRLIEIIKVFVSSSVVVSE